MRQHDTNSHAHFLRQPEPWLCQNYCGKRVPYGRARYCSDDCARAARYIRHKYHITPRDIHRMLQEQNHRCPICTREISRPTLQVDHDHATGELRGLLCRACNLTLGMVEDNPETLRRAVQYLQVISS